MKHLLISMATTDVMEPSPWPIVVQEDGRLIHGRPDAHTLLGFARPHQPYDVKVHAHHLNPEQEVDYLGLAPVYIARDGTFFTVPIHIVTGVREYTADVHELNAANDRMVAALLGRALA